MYYPALANRWNDTLPDTIKINAYNRYDKTNSTVLVNTASLYKDIVQAIRNEMIDTVNLTKWPCKPFRDYSASSSTASIEESMLALPIQSLAADCGAKHVKCSIQYDIEEYKRISKLEQNKIM